MPIPDAGIVALFDDIDGPVFHDDGQPYVGIDTGERHDRRFDQQMGRVREHVDAQFAMGRHGRVDEPERRTDRVEAVAQALCKFEADTGRGDGTRGTVQQLHGEARFQPAHGVAGCRGRQAQLDGGRLEAARAHDGKEQAQVGEIDAIDQGHG